MLICLHVFFNTIGKALRHVPLYEMEIQIAYINKQIQIEWKYLRYERLQSC